MKPSRQPLWSLFAILAIGFFFASVPVLAGQTILAQFPAQEKNPSGLVQGSDGNLYGTANGGQYNQGEIFMVTPSSGVRTVLFSFNGANGSGPFGMIKGNDGNFYGVTYTGGAANLGTVFKFTTAGVLTTLVSFDGVSGALPATSLFQASDGNFYGGTQEKVTNTNGSDGGILYRVTPQGILTIFHDFSGNYVNGNFPSGPLIEGTDGELYGTTDSGGASNSGTIYEISLMGIFTILHSFSGSDGEGPSGIILATDGNFYGTTPYGGFADGGLVYQFTPSGVLNIIHNFSNSSESFTYSPGPGLIQGSNGNLYGSTTMTSSYYQQAYPGGEVFQMTTTGTMVEEGLFNGADGSSCNSPLIQASDGNFYGTTSHGGAGQGSTAYGGGTVFELNSYGAIQTLSAFTSSGAVSPVGNVTQGSDGNFYGVTTMGGLFNEGAFYQISSTGTLTTLHSFSGSDGTYPNCDLFQGSDGDFYGTSNAVSFSNASAIFFKVDTSGNLTAIASVPGTNNGEFAPVPVIPASDGNYYGLTALGTSGYGSLVQITPTGACTVLASFDLQTTGGYPTGKLLQGADGNLYGTLLEGGPLGYGTLFKFTIASGTLTTVYNFTQSDGNPNGGGVILATDGNYYGVTDNEVYRMTPAGTVSTFAVFDPNSSLLYSSPLCQASDGNFYATAFVSDSVGKGTVYEVTAGGVVQTVLAFNGSNGDGPGPTGLMKASDGSLYGITQQGGNANLGLVYRLSFGSPDAQTITFPTLGDQTIGGAPATLTATASSGLAVVYSVVSGPATISGNVVTFTGAGTVVIQASQAGSPFVQSTTATQSVTVNLQSQVISPFAPISTQTYGNKKFAVATPLASSALPVTVSVQSGPATFSGGYVTITGAGVVTLAASQGGNSFFSPATVVTTSFTVNQASQTIGTLKKISTQTFGVAPFKESIPTATSGLPVTLSILSGPATISGSTITVTSPGTVVVAADQLGNANYSAAPEVTTSFSVNQASQKISSFKTISDKSYTTVPFAITLPTSNSGLPVTVTVLSGPAMLAGDEVTITGIGKVELAANQPGNVDYSPAPQVTTTFTVNKASQTISAFATISKQTYGVAPFAVSLPTSSSGLPVTTTVKSGPATLSGNVVTITGAGTVKLVANQAGNADYDAASQVSVSFTVAKASETLSAWVVIPTQSYGEAPFTITPPTASSGLAVTTSVKSGPATVSGDLVTITGVGTVELKATQAGNSNYDAATSVTTSFTVQKGTQTINAFAPIATQTYGEAAFKVTPPTASSGLTVTVSVLSGPAKISDSDKITLSGTGTVTLQASQAGNSKYDAATPVTTSFDVVQSSEAESSFR